MDTRPVNQIIERLGDTAGSAARGWPAQRAQRMLRDGTRFASRRLRYWSNVLDGVAYRLGQGVPEPDVSDEVLTQRVRSELGRLLKTLDLPRLNVSVTGGVASLHGYVADASDARLIEAQVGRISGVRGVESYLTVGLPPSVTRPSEGHAEQAESDAHKRLIAAAVEAGVPAAMAPPLVRATLGVLVDRLPEGDARHLVTHLPDDVKALAGPPRRRGRRPTGQRTVEELVRSVVQAAHEQEPEYIDLTAIERAEAVVEAVFAALQELVPEEARDVAGVLPAELRDLWVSAGRSPS